MELSPLLNDALDEALRHAAFHSETHAIKGVMALNRLRSVPGVDEDLLRRALGFRELLDGAKVEILVHEQISHPIDRVEDLRLQRMIGGAVFPMAYAAGVEWVKRHGFKHMVEHYRDRAIERTGFLGHSWSIWCSFSDVEPYLKTDAQQRWAAERFVEFCATQLSSPHWSFVYDLDSELETHDLDEDALITAILTRPGYFGHTVIGLAYILEYEALISPEQRNHALKRMYDASQVIWEIPAFDIEVQRPVKGEDVSRADLDQAIIRLMQMGPEEVHTATLSDAIIMLWNRVADGHRPHLLENLKVFAEWTNEREASGERKGS